MKPNFKYANIPEDRRSLCNKGVFSENWLMSSIPSRNLLHLIRIYEFYYPRSAISGSGLLRRRCFAPPINLLQLHNVSVADLGGLWDPASMLNFSICVFGAPRAPADYQEPYAVVVLLEKDLVVIDLAQNG